MCAGRALMHAHKHTHTRRHVQEEGKLWRKNTTSLQGEGNFKEMPGIVK